MIKSVFNLSQKLLYYPVIYRVDFFFTNQRNEIRLLASGRGDCKLLLKVTGLHFQLTAVKVNSIAVNELLGVNRRGLWLT